MTDIVTGTPDIVGFTNGYGNRGDCCHGVSDKDQGFMTTIDAGERTRDILHAIRDTVVAVEKTGAANSLAVAKIGSASVLTIHEQSHSLALQLCNTEAKLAAQMAACCCDMRKDLAEVKATVLEVDSNRIRDDLAQTRAELLALRTYSSNPGNS